MLQLVARSVLANWAGFAVHAIATFLLTPYVLGKLGPERYGAWILTCSLVGYYGMLDLGFRAGLNQFMTRDLARRDYDALNQTINSVYRVLLGLSLLVLLASIAGAQFGPACFSLSETLSREFGLCVLFVGCSTAAQFLLFPFSVVLVATLRHDLANLVGVATRVLQAVCIYLVLERGYGLVGVSVAFSATNLLDYVIRWSVARQLVPELRINLRQFAWGRLRKVALYGGWNVGITVSIALVSYSDSLIIAFFLPVAMVTPYALASRLAYQMCDGLLSAARRVFFPVAVQQHAMQDDAGLRRTFFDGSRLLFTCATVLLALMFVWCDEFYRLWIGDEEFTTKTFDEIVLLARIQLLATVIPFLGGTADQILLATRRMRDAATGAILECVANLILSLILIVPFGLVGVAVGTLVARSFCGAYWFPRRVANSLNVSLPTFYLNTVPRPFICGGIAFLVAGLCNQFVPVSNWSGFFAGTGASLLGVMLAVLCFGVTREERKVVWSWVYRGQLGTKVA